MTEKRSKIQELDHLIYERGKVERNAIASNLYKFLELAETLEYTREEKIDVLEHVIEIAITERERSGKNV